MFGLAINRKYRTRQGDDREEVTFVDCEYWGRSADQLAKGDTIFAHGRLKLDQWDDRDTGKQRSRLAVVIEQIHVLETTGARTESAATNTAPVDDASIPF